MTSRGFVLAAAMALASSFPAFAQVKLPTGPNVLPVRQSEALAVNPNIAGGQSRILWIRNDKTGQVVKPGELKDRKAKDDPQPIFIYNNYDNPEGLVGLNLNWNFKEAYTDPDFVPPTNERILFGYLDIASDPSDPDEQLDLVNGEKLCLIFEPYHAMQWPVGDLNVSQPLTEYTSIVASYSEQLEIRVCRIYFFALTDVNQPFDQQDNPYVLDVQLSFAFVSFPFFGVESVFSFDLSGFDPPLNIKGDGLVFTHWLKFSEPPDCVGDIDENGLVDDADFVMFLAQYNVLDCADENMPDFCTADFNFDGFVDDADFLEFIKGYNDLLCPPPFVIRNAYAPIAGGRFRWDNENNYPFNVPLSQAVPAPGGWPFPNDLVSVPNLGSGPYPEPFEIGCDYFRCQPSFLMYFSTLTGFQNVNELNMEATDLKAEYERFMNEIAIDKSSTGLMRPYAIYDVQSLIDSGSGLETDWVPSSTAKRFSVTPLAPPASR